MTMSVQKDNLTETCKEPMQLETYPFIKSPENRNYEFYSEGPNGKIKKVVEYFRLPELDAEVFNLAFGDWDENNNCINDLSTSNNADRDKVLATVVEFMEKHPNAIIIATGSTMSRTRLYQMGISKLWNEINELFEVQGYIDEVWQPFKQGVNYKSFLLMLR